jgi:hypothetical protein
MYADRQDNHLPSATAIYNKTGKKRKVFFCLFIKTSINTIVH